MSRSPINSDHHVHFDISTIKDEFESENSVTYQKNGESIIVNLGFLQINHRYSIDLKLPSEIFGGFKDSPILVPEDSDSTSAVPNIHCRITEFTGQMHENKKYFEMKVEFFAYKEKLLKEQLKIVNSKNSQEILKLIITARILGKGKGTPMLRNGIHCVGIERNDDESEASDYAGFEKGED